MDRCCVLFMTVDIHIDPRTFWSVIGTFCYTGDNSIFFETFYLPYLDIFTRKNKFSKQCKKPPKGCSCRLYILIYCRDFVVYKRDSKFIASVCKQKIYVLSTGRKEDIFVSFITPSIIQLSLELWQKYHLKIIKIT